MKELKGLLAIFHVCVRLVGSSNIDLGAVIIEKDPPMPLASHPTSVESDSCPNKKSFRDVQPVSLQKIRPGCGCVFGVEATDSRQRFHPRDYPTL